MRLAANGNFAGSPNTCTWRSLAPGGTWKSGAVCSDGMAAAAMPACRVAADTPAAPIRWSMSRLVNTAVLLFYGPHGTPTECGWHLFFRRTGRTAGCADAGEIFRRDRAAARRAGEMIVDDGRQPKHNDDHINSKHHLFSR